MIFERVEVEGLSHYSYILGCPADGRMVVVDPKRDVQQYIDFARKRGLTISHVLETHIHADYASGAHELAERTGASVWASRYDRGETFEVSFDHVDVSDGDALDIGSIRIIALHTPGHTPEHLSFLVYDRNRSQDVPMAMLTGDFLFVGSLGRPDLLGEEAKLELAKKLYHSVHAKLKNLPDSVEVYPAHGAGSLCGAGMSGRPLSTLGYERIANPYLDPSLTEEQFVQRILGTVPPFPEYYKRMKRVNSIGAESLGMRDIPAVAPGKASALIGQDHVVIDLRDQKRFAAGHIPKSFGIGSGNLLAVWASWVVPYDRPILLVASDAAEANEAAVSLSRVGLDNVVGFIDGGIDAWKAESLPIDSYQSISPRQLHDRLQRGDDVQVIDVRSDSEWNAGHIEGAIHLFGGELEKHLDQLPTTDQPLAMVCGGGYRSTVAASVLKRHGFNNLLNVTGGMGAWRKEQLPLAQHQQQVAL